MTRGQRIAVGIVGTLSSVLLHAQPEFELRDAVEELMKAGNYAWEHRAQYGVVKVRAPRATGETTIGEFTTAQIGTRKAVMFDHEIAFAVKGRWRHGNDLTAEDLTALRVSEKAARYVNHVHPLPHELLALVLPAARNVEKQAGVLSAEIDPAVLDALALTQYLTRASLPSAKGRSIIGFPVPPRRSPVPPTTRNMGMSMLFVWVDKGLPTRITVEIQLSNPPRESVETDARTTTHEFKILEAGTTHPFVPAEAKALFLDAAAGRRGR
jgi:hypothetical protein